METDKKSMGPDADRERCSREVLQERISLLKETLALARVAPLEEKDSHRKLRAEIVSRFESRVAQLKEALAAARKMLFLWSASMNVTFCHLSTIQPREWTGFFLRHTTLNPRLTLQRRLKNCWSLRWCLLKVNVF